LLRSAFVATCFALVATAASAQVTPAAGYTPPDDAPAIRVGTTIYANAMDQTQPTVADVDGNQVKKSSFDVARAYINITGQISHLIQFRVTPDVSRETACPAATCSLSGSNVFRMKYGYVDLRMDDWMPRGSYVRLGLQQTPYIDYTESIYRYRFQGTTFTERAGYYASADAGASFYYNMPSNYGTVHVGIFNGENYNKVEVNNQKALMGRLTLRPFATKAPIARGLRVTGFYDNDNYAGSDERKRAVGQVTFEHNYVNAGFEYIDAKDQASQAVASVHSKGWALWATPKAPMANGSSIEALLRYDHLTPNTSGSFATGTTTVLDDQKQNRSIVGVAYWFPHTGGPTTALLLDYDGQSFKGLSTTPNHSIAIHALVNY
jgi:hypothetical protein